MGDRESQEGLGSDLRGRQKGRCPTVSLPLGSSARPSLGRLVPLEGQPPPFLPLSLEKPPEVAPLPVALFLVALVRPVNC